MDVVNCPKCGKIFTRLRDPICEECKKQDEEDFQIVRNYLKENPKSILAEVVEQTGVSLKRIQRYLREGRLEVSEGIADNLVCLSCGKPIVKGRFCRVCALELTQKVIPRKEEPEVKDKYAKKSHKMHHDFTSKN